jgi:hypothetical protein
VVVGISKAAKTARTKTQKNSKKKG